MPKMRFQLPDAAWYVQFEHVAGRIVAEALGVAFGQIGRIVLRGGGRAARIEAAARVVVQPARRADVLAGAAGG